MFGTVIIINVTIITDNHNSRKIFAATKTMTIIVITVNNIDNQSLVINQ